jgi:hypothetical protein
MTDAMRYTIEDPRPIAEENPWTYYYPCEARRLAVSAGDGVKLLFGPPKDAEGMTERMWVLVTGVDPEDPEFLIGRLGNEPVIRAMDFGEEVRFSRHHVIEIVTERTDDPEETCVQDDRAFARCLLDERVWSGDEPPARATNGHPQPADYDGGPMDFPWGGWRIVGADWKEGMPLTIGTPAGVSQKDAGIMPHILGNEEDGSVIVEKIDGEWRSRAA